MMRGWSNWGEKQKILEVRWNGKNTITASNMQTLLQRKRICSTSLSVGDRAKVFDFALNLTFLAIIILENSGWEPCGNCQQSLDAHRCGVTWVDLEVQGDLWCGTPQLCPTLQATQLWCTSFALCWEQWNGDAVGDTRTCAKSIWRASHFKGECSFLHKLLTLTV